LKIAKWGNSLAVRVPVRTVEELGLVEGDEVDIALTKLNVPFCKTSDEIRAAFDALDKLRGAMPVDFKFNREDANAR
jgi:antitoxin MazE